MRIDKSHLSARRYSRVRTGNQTPYAVVEHRGQTPPFALVDGNGAVDEAVPLFLLDLIASDRSLATIKTYAYALLDWVRFLHRCEKTWRQAEPSNVRDYVLHLRTADNPYRRRRPDSVVPGSLNPRTGKATLAPGYKATTINHRLSVIKAFYASLERRDDEDVLHPVPHSRTHTHHNPLAPWVQIARDPYRQHEPKRSPRALSEDIYDEAFGALTHDRDRAIVSLLVSSACRAQELLGMALADLDWSRQCVRLVSKGSRDEVWVAASPTFFRWLAVHLAQRPACDPTSPLWVTLRGPERALTYQALRAILNRVNAKLGTNLVLHDFRHTCALRLASDPEVALVDVQAHLRHRHLSTTERYLVARPDEVVRAVQRHQQRRGAASQSQAKPSPKSLALPESPWQYDPDDLDALLGGLGGGVGTGEGE
jgi:integrase